MLFFFNDTATTEIYTLSLHDALPILLLHFLSLMLGSVLVLMLPLLVWLTHQHQHAPKRSEERFSRNAETDIVCRLLLEKKKSIGTTTKTIWTVRPPFISFCVLSLSFP